MGGTPVLVVKGGGLCLKGCGFESRRHRLEGHFFALICCKKIIVCLKRPKMNQKDARVGPFLTYNSYIGRFNELAGTYNPEE